VFILHVDLSVKPGMTKALEGTYRDVFVPAISKHAGFSESKLLRAISSEAHSHRNHSGLDRQAPCCIGSHELRMNLPRNSVTTLVW